MKRRIEYKGKVLETAYWEEISVEEYNTAVNEYYTLPDKSAVLKQLKKIKEGGTKLNFVTHYYFRRLMGDVKLHYNKWTINDVFNCKELVEYMSAKAKQNTKVYPTSWSLCKKMIKMFGLAGKGVASPPTQFPLSAVDSILSKYNVNNNWYDYSCGWGVRFLGALKNNVNYFGTDPNYLLLDKLNELYQDYQSVNWSTSYVLIYCSGSEEFQPKLENSIGLAFSSPPYFDLEDYQIGNQSYKEGTTYAEWLDNYVKPTIQNIYKYLISGGYFIINIKDTKTHNLEKDWKEIAEATGFTFVCIEELNVHNRSFGVQGGNGKNHQHNGNEQIYVFQK